MSFLKRLYQVPKVQVDIENLDNLLSLDIPLVILFVVEFKVTKVVSTKVNNAIDEDILARHLENVSFLISPLQELNYSLARTFEFFYLFIVLFIFFNLKDFESSRPINFVCWILYVITIVTFWL